MTAYLGGAIELILAIGAAGAGAVRLRSRLLAGWSGPPAWLADSILAIALLIWIGELLGAFGLLRPVAFTAACLGAGLGIRLLVPRGTAREGDVVPLSPAVPRAGVYLAIGIAALLVAHWSIRTGIALDSGITGFDSAWYHMPFTAHFVQTGSTVDFVFTAPRYLTWFYPANSELLHAIGVLPFHRDLLSPLLNLVWLSGCLLAAWSVGRPYGAGVWCVAGAALLLDSGVLADQAGDARNDTLGLYFLLAGAAVLVNAAAGRDHRRLPAGPLAVAGLSVGMAAGTKVTFLAPAAGLAIGITALAVRGERGRAALAFGGPLLAGCGFWFGRNLVATGNPLPWIQSLGPLRLDGPTQALGGRPQFSILDYISDWSAWSHWFLPGLADRLGALWPLLLALAGAGLLAAMLTRREPLLAVLGIAGLLAVVAWLVHGTSAEGPPGMPVGFKSSLRHLAPALLLGLVLLPLVPGLRTGRRRWFLLGSMLVLLPVVDRSADPWSSTHLAAALAVGGAVALGGLAIFWLRAVARPAVGVGVGGLAALTLVLGWFEQRQYLGDRYAEPAFRSAGLNAAYDWANRLRGARIATTLVLQYPLFGTDLSNRVEYLGQRRGDGGFVRLRTCPEWRSALDRGGFRYLVTTAGPRQPDPAPPELLDGDVGADLVLRRRNVVVLRLGPRSAEAACRAPRSELASRANGDVSSPSHLARIEVARIERTGGRER